MAAAWTAAPMVSRPSRHRFRVDASLIAGKSAGRLTGCSEKLDRLCRSVKMQLRFFNSARQGASTLGPGSIECVYSVSTPPSSVPPPGGVDSRQKARFILDSSIRSPKRSTATQLA